MKIRTLVTALALGLAVVSPALRAQDSDTKTDLEKQMDRINKSMRALKKQVSDASQNAASLQLVATIEDAAAQASKMTPAKANDVPADQRDKFVSDYQAGMKEFIGAVDKLQSDLKAGDNDAAAKDLQGLLSLEKKDHKQYRKPKDD